MRIYLAAFPEWEREPEHILTSRLHTQRYRFWVGLLGGEVVGFYLLDRNRELGYALLSFLGVARSQRGRGVGTALCRDAMRRIEGSPGYDLLLVEAQDRQARFYGRLGFLKLALNYEVPRFDGPGTMPMHLMVVPRARRLTSIPRATLRPILSDLVVSGYSLAEDDPRVAAQLSKVGDQTPLIRWPPEATAPTE